MRIVLDAMGGDHAPEETVAGAVEAARALGLEVLLVGVGDPIRAQLALHDTAGLKLEVVPASEVVGMDEHAVAAVRDKKGSSMAVGMDLVKRKEGDAFVSAGNSGAVMATALFRLGRLPGVERPAIGVRIPTQRTPVFIIDIGANVDCRPAHMLQFGEMGSAYMASIGGIARPRVGLLSNGEEDTKGNQLVQETNPLLRASTLNFVGNMEGKDVARGSADVLVTDGFTGNVIIKWSEGISELIFGLLRGALTSRLQYKLAAAVAKPALRKAGAALDYTEYGGAPLLGVDGVVIIAHGRSRAVTIKNALRAAKQAVEGGVTEAIRSGMAARASR